MSQKKFIVKGYARKANKVTSYSRGAPNKPKKKTKKG